MWTWVALFVAFIMFIFIVDNNNGADGNSVGV